MHKLLETLESRTLFSADAVLEWNSVLLDSVRAAKTPPPYAARNMAIVHIAVFDAVNAIDGEFEGYTTQRNGPKGASETAAVAQAAHDTLAALYPTRKSIFDAALNSSLAGVPDGAAENKGVAVGRDAAKQILAERKDDGADRVVTYTPGKGPDDWKPTPPAFAPALLPQWPDVTPFALQSGDQFRAPAPPALSSDEFTTAFNHVKEIGAVNSTTRTAEQTQIALFWADGAGTATPPGHWNLIAQNVAQQQHNTLAQNARLFALLNIGLADAGIVSWDSKYSYDFIRPVTAIRNADNDGNPDTTANVDWSPLIATPPFPSYTSGHSTFSAAAAAVLAGFFGADQIAFTTTSENPAAGSRTFTSFSQAAAEAGASRVYGGIHWDFDNTAGLASGKQVGQYVVSHLLLPDDAGHGTCDPVSTAATARTIFNTKTKITRHGLLHKQEKPIGLRQEPASAARWFFMAR
jgi:membrane-associated phospholipid phosphatase